MCVGSIIYLITHLFVKIICVSITNNIDIWILCLLGSSFYQLSDALIIISNYYVKHNNEIKIKMIYMMLYYIGLFMIFISCYFGITKYIQPIRKITIMV